MCRITPRRNALVLGMVLLLAVGVCAQAQSPTYGLGRTPTAEEVAAWDIAISPDGKELPVGSGTVAEGEELFTC